MDNEDYEELSKAKWRARKICRVFYAMRTQPKNGKRSSVFMYRFILGVAGKQRVDHINRDGLDNRKANLRLCSNAQNGMNSKWEAAIKLAGRRFFLGLYSSKEEAASAYDVAARKMFGEFARLNSHAASGGGTT